MHPKNLVFCLVGGAISLRISCLWFSSHVYRGWCLAYKLAYKNTGKVDDIASFYRYFHWRCSSEMSQIISRLEVNTYNLHTSSWSLWRLADHLFSRTHSSNEQRGFGRCFPRHLTFRNLRTLLAFTMISEHYRISLLLRTRTKQNIYSTRNLEMITLYRHTNLFLMLMFDCSLFLNFRSFWWSYCLRLFLAHNSKIT